LPIDSIGLHMVNQMLRRDSDRCIPDPVRRQRRGRGQ
jgi:hypothetical protein